MSSGRDGAVDVAIRLAGRGVRDRHDPSGNFGPRAHLIVQPCLQGSPAAFPPP
jgi:hypothetical protein